MNLLSTYRISVWTVEFICSEVMSYNALMSSDSSSTEDIASEPSVESVTTGQLESPRVVAEHPRNVWCTLVMLNDNYACGAVAMAHAMRAHGTKYPLWCMVSDGVTDNCEQWLAKYFDRVLRVPLIEHDVIPMKSKKQNMIYGAWISKSFTKCHIFNPALFPVDKVILLDADSLPVANIDRNQPQTNPYGEMKHGSVVPMSKIREGFSSILGLACMVLIHPTDKHWAAFNKFLNKEKKYGHNGCIGGFDEQILSETLLSIGDPIHHIHQQYNWVVGKNNWLLHGETPKLFQWYNDKPWNQERGTWPDLVAWYTVWDEVVANDSEASRWLAPSSCASSEVSLAALDRAS